MSANQCGCCGSKGPKLIFPCSGAADVGAVSDQAGRLLTREGKGRMFCLAGVGARLPTFMETTSAASGILAIDGCPQACASKCLEEAGFTGIGVLALHEHGFEKGRSPADAANIRRAADLAAPILDAM